MILILTTAHFALLGSQLLAERNYRGSATNRSENIWWRVDPAEDTAIRGYLQRGDEIVVTDDGVAADGDEFYPGDVVDTRERLGARVGN